MAGTPQQRRQLQWAQNIKENKTKEGRKEAINLFVASNLRI